MKTKIHYLNNKAQKEIASFNCDVLPEIGDLAYVPDADGIFTHGKVLSKEFDFTSNKGEVFVDIIISPLKTEIPK